MTLLPAVACFALLGYALYVQYVMYLDPCPLCILQRVVFIAIGVLFVVAAVKPVKGWGRTLLGLLVVLWCGMGLYLSGLHVWLQSLPPEEVPACGPGLYLVLEQSPFFEVLSNVLKGSGECAESVWDFWGLSMPAWTLIWYAGLLVYTVVWMRIKVQEKSV